MSKRGPFRVPTIQFGKLGDPISADVVNGRYAAVCEGEARMLEEVARAPHSSSTASVLLQAIRGRASDLVNRICDAIRHTGRGELPELAEAAGPPASTDALCRQQLQDLASRAAGIATDWQVPCMCFEHLLLAIVEACAEATPEGHRRAIIRAAEDEVVAQVHGGVHPKKYAEEMLIRIGQAAQGDARALEEMDRQFDSAITTLATGYAEQNGLDAERVRRAGFSLLRDAVRSFRGHTILDFRLHLWEVLQDALDHYRSNET